MSITRFARNGAAVFLTATPLVALSFPASAVPPTGLKEIAPSAPFTVTVASHASTTQWHARPCLRHTLLDQLRSR